jgi:hypothetical protein
MHANIQAYLIATCVPSALILCIALIMRLRKSKGAKAIFFVGLGALLLPLSSLYSHFSTQYSEMKERAGTFVVIRQENIEGPCAGARFDSLQLSLQRNGKYSFNYRPCFTAQRDGNWGWSDNMVRAHAWFESMNDSLSLGFPSDFKSDTIELTSYKKRYLTFARQK